MNIRLTCDPRKADRIVLPPRKIRDDGEELRRSLTFDGSALEPTAMTVRAIVATTTPVIRKDGKGLFNEVLAMSGRRAADGEDLPLLADHAATARTTVGRAHDFKIEDGALTAALRFSMAADVEPIVQRVQDRTLRHVSAGYVVHRWVESVDAAGVRTKTAVDWSLVEISIVPIPADPNSKIKRSTTEMEDDIIELTPAQVRAEIRTIGRAAGMKAEDIDDMIDRDLDPVAARAEAFEHMQARLTPRIRVTASHDDPAAVTTRAADALAHRMGATGELPAASREYASMTMVDLLKDSATRAGISTRGLGVDDLMVRMQHTSSDFPTLVSNAMGKVALQAYTAAASPLKGFARQRILSNFKASTSIRLGELGKLEPMSESGEFTGTTRAENGEVMQLGTFGRAINVSRQLIINDDLGLLGDMTAALGAAAAATEAEELVSLFTANPDLSDGTAVFAAGRGNYATTGSALAEASLSTARVAMRKTKGLDGKTIIDAQPKYLLVSPDLELAAEKLLAAIYATTTDDVNVHAGKLTLLVEPRLTGNGWFLLSDRVPTIQYGYLAGAQGVQIQQSESWSTLGLKYRAWLDFGCGWTDWRGAYAATGAA